MKKSKPYAKLVRQAEEATNAIRNPELRRVAFERVLDDLVSGGGSTQEAGPRTGKRPKRSTRTAARRRRPKGPIAYVRELIEDGFFKKPKTIAEVKAELGNRGHHIALTSLSGPLQRLCKDRVLRRHKPKAGAKGKKALFNYSEW